MSIYTIVYYSAYTIAYHTYNIVYNIIMLVMKRCFVGCNTIVWCIGIVDNIGCAHVYVCVYVSMRVCSCMRMFVYIRV